MTRAILPKVDGVGNVGSAARLWKTLYINRLTFADGTYMESADDVGGGGVISQEFDTGWITLAAYNAGNPTANVYTGLHGLGGSPKFCMVKMKRTIGGTGSSTLYDNEDIIWMGETQLGQSNSDVGFAIKFTSTNYWIRNAHGTYIILYANKQGDYGDIESYEASNWKFKVVFYR